MTLQRSIRILYFCATALCTLRVSARDPVPTTAPTTAPVASRHLSETPFADEGAFNLYVNEDRIAVCRFKLSANGALESQCVITFSGQSITTVTHVTPDANGRWKQVKMQTPAGLVSIERDGDEARVTAQGEADSVKIDSGTLLMDTSSPVLISYAVRAYDRAKKGRQVFQILAPGKTQATLEFKATTEKSVGGKDLTLDRYMFTLPGIDVTLWADMTGKLYVLDIPAQHTAYVRDGYEILRQDSAQDPKVSKPEYSVKQQTNLRVAMRDGVHLATDIYRPDASGKFPVILSRTPYDRRLLESQARFYARRGYVFAAQDCRGRFSSEGSWEPFVNEKGDGYDSIEWLAAQPWSNGKVGMIGASYVGAVQWWAASLHPPHLVTMIPNVAPPEPFYNIPYEHGVFFLYGAIWWADIVERMAAPDLAGELAAFADISDKKYDDLLRSLPVIDLDKKVLGKENPYWRAWIEHWTDDEYWHRADFYDDLKDVDLPVFHQSGWYDGDGIGSELNYQKMIALGHGNQKLTLGPWGHTDTATRTLGDWDFGAGAVIDLQREYLRWFDHWLKGVNNGIDKEPLVSIFVMGSNRWLRGNNYPLPATQFQKWYLSSDGKANTSKGSGHLGISPPSADAPTDHYAYDPGNPTPNPDWYVPDDGNAKSTTAPATQKTTSEEQEKKLSKAYHAKVTAARQDILVYTSAPLVKPLTFAGPMSAVIYAASTAKDTDWYVRLIEINKDGQLWTRGSGRLRARFRASNRDPQLLKPGEIYEYHLDLWQTGVEIRAGNRLRVEICSADFPSFSRNLNTGGHSETETKFITAQQAIYHDAEHPSYVLLPIIPPDVLMSHSK